MPSASNGSRRIASPPYLPMHRSWPRSCDAGSFASQSEIIAALVRRITVAQDKVTIEIDRKALAERLLDQEASSTSRGKNRRPITIEVPVRFRRRGVEAKLIVLESAGPAPEPDANLVKALARAHEWFGRIVRGEANGIGDIASAERLCRTYVTRVLCLAFLAPEITKAILEGRQPTELTAKRLISRRSRSPCFGPISRGTVSPAFFYPSPALLIDPLFPPNYFQHRKACPVKLGIGADIRNVRTMGPGAWPLIRHNISTPLQSQRDNPRVRREMSPPSVHKAGVLSQDASLTNLHRLIHIDEHRLVVLKPFE